MNKYLIKYYLSSGAIIEREVEAETLNEAKVSSYSSTYDNEEKYTVNIKQDHLIATEINQVESIKYDESDPIIL